jgi:hypothetical protein
MVEEGARLDRQGLRGWTPLARGGAVTTSGARPVQLWLGSGGRLAVRTGSVRFGTRCAAATALPVVEWGVEWHPAQDAQADHVVGVALLAKGRAQEEQREADAP